MQKMIKESFFVMLQIVMLHVLFDEPNSKLQDQVIIDGDEDYAVLEKQARTTNESVEKGNQSTKIYVHNNLPKDWTTPKELSKDNIIRDIDKGFCTRTSLIIFLNILHLYHKLNKKM